MSKIHIAIDLSIKNYLKQPIHPHLSNDFLYNEQHSCETSASHSDIN